MPRLFFTTQTFENSTTFLGLSKVALLFSWAIFLTTQALASCTIVLGISKTVSSIFFEKSSQKVPLWVFVTIYKLLNVFEESARAILPRNLAPVFFPAT